MKRVYLDTSVFFRIFFDEPEKDTIHRIVRLAEEKKIKIVISEWVINESLAAIEKKISKGKIDNTDAYDTLLSIAKFLEECYKNGTVISNPINEDVVLTSKIMIQTLRITASDALHVHVALASNCSYFVSADRGLCTQMSILNAIITPVDIYINSDVVKFFKDVDPT